MARDHPMDPSYKNRGALCATDQQAVRDAENSGAAHHRLASI